MVRRLLPGRRPLFPDPRGVKLGDDGFAFIGGDLSPDSLTEAFSKGFFPWDGDKPYPWFSPDPRLVLFPERFHASHSLRKRVRQGRLTVRYDGDIEGVIRACGAPRPNQAGTWVSDRYVAVYRRLKERGTGHCVEVFEDGVRVGGLFGLAHGRIFCGESMFATQRDASKVGFWDLCLRLAAAGYHLVDCQADTSHLRSLGAELIPREAFLDRLERGWGEPDGWAEAMAAPGLAGAAADPVR